jgi:hypothetical protein
MFKKIGESKKSNVDEACQEVYGMSLEEVYGTTDIQQLIRDGWMKIDIFEGTVTFYADEAGEK